MDFTYLLLVMVPFVTIQASMLKDYGQRMKKGDDGRTICPGTGDAMSIDFNPGVEEDQERYLARLRLFYAGCQIVQNNVEIGFLNESYTSADLAFLGSIEEIHGHLLLFYVRMEEFSLPNLKIIWGDSLYKMNRDKNSSPGSAEKECNNSFGYYSMLVLNNPNLKILNLPKLKAISRGIVGVISSPKLCHVHTIDWREILGSNWKKRLCIYNNSQKNDSNEAPSAEGELNCSTGSTVNTNCSASCEYPHCWGPEDSQCQIVYRKGCHTACKSGMCFIDSDENACCHSQCLAGCNGTTNADCEACMNFKQDGKCIEHCPKIREYDRITGLFKINPNGRYKYFKECVKRCPEHMPIKDDACLSQCPKGTKEVPFSEAGFDRDIYAGMNPDAKYCKSCDKDSDCGHARCKVASSLGVTSENIDRLTGCTHIEDSLVIRMTAFQNGSCYSTYTDAAFGRFVNLTPITKEQLYGLQSIRSVAGHVSIELHGKSYPNWLNSASFLANLETIDGRNNMLRGRRFALYVAYTQFCYLGLRSLKRIKNGDVMIASNHKLCYSEEIPWTSNIMLASSSMVWKNNRHANFCREDGEVCHSQCEGCWGPGPDLCYECKQYNYYGSCIGSCDTENGRYANDTEPNICLKCHKECATCFGPENNQCHECVHVELDGRCVVKCPYGMYPSTSGIPGKAPVCQRCSPGCAHEPMVMLRRQPVCTGGANITGSDGCNRCKNAIKIPVMDSNATNVTYELMCVSNLDKDKHDCSSYKFTNYFQTAPERDLEKLVANRICQPCHSECNTCNGYGPKVFDNGCECRHFSQNEECVPECKSNLYPENGTCMLCDEQCDGCRGPTSADCVRCKKKKIYAENQQYLEYEEEVDDCHQFICLATCPTSFPHTMEINKEEICTAKDPHYRQRIIQLVIGLILGAVLLVLILVAITAFIYRRKASFLQVFGKSLELEPVETKLNPDAKPNLSRLTLMKEDELRRAGILGSGAFGTVYKGVWIPKGEHVKIPVAIKILNETTPKAQEEMLEEAHRMAGLCHIFLVRLVGVSLSSPDMMLVTPLMPLGNLSQYVAKHKSSIGSSALLRWIHQIAVGMSYLEANHVVHRDLAARNVLVQTPKHVRIADFGLSKVIDFGEDEYKASGGKLPIKWLALESILYNRYTHKTDVWSFGVTVWEVLTFGSKPYPGVSVGVKPLHEFLERGERLPQPEICTIDIFMILVKCWLVNADSRPSFVELAELFAKMREDPPRYLVIPGDRLLRLPSVGPAEEKHLLEEMVPDKFLDDFREENEETVQRLGQMALVPVGDFLGDCPEDIMFPPSPSSPITPDALSDALTHPALNDQKLSSGSQRYASNPFKGFFEKSSCDDVTIRCLPDEITDKDNYLIPNSRNQNIILPYIEVINEESDVETDDQHDFFSHQYYNELPTSGSPTLSRSMTTKVNGNCELIDNPEYLLLSQTGPQSSIDNMDHVKKNQNHLASCKQEPVEYLVSSTGGDPKFMWAKTNYLNCGTWKELGNPAVRATLQSSDLDRDICTYSEIDPLLSSKGEHNHSVPGC